jgi:hypothetical protein
MSDFPLHAVFDLLNDVDKLINIVNSLSISVTAGIMSTESEAILFNMMIDKFISEVHQAYTVTLLNTHKEEFIKFVRMKVTMITSSSQHEQGSEQSDEQDVTLYASSNNTLNNIHHSREHISPSTFQDDSTPCEHLAAIPNHRDTSFTSTTIQHCDEQCNRPIPLRDQLTNEDLLCTATDSLQNTVPQYKDCTISEHPVSLEDVPLQSLQTRIGGKKRKKAPVYLYDTEIFKYKTLCPVLDVEKAALVFNNKFVCSFDPLKKLENKDQLRNNIDNETCIFRCSCGNGNFSLQFRHYKNCKEDEKYLFQVFVKNKALQDVLLHFNTLSDNKSFAYGIINNETSVEDFQIDDELLDCKPPATAATEQLVDIATDTGTSTGSTDTTSKEKNEVAINCSQNFPTTDDHFTERTIDLTEELVNINTKTTNCTDSTDITSTDGQENKMDSHNSFGTPIPQEQPQIINNANAPCNSNRPTTPTIIVTAMLENSHTTDTDKLLESTNLSRNQIPPIQAEPTINSTRTEDKSLLVATQPSAATFRTPMANTQHSRLTVTVNLVNDIYDENDDFHDNFLPPLPRFIGNNVSTHDIRIHANWYRDNIMYPLDYLQRKSGFYTLTHLPEIFDSYSDEFYDNEENEYCVACTAKTIGRNQIAAYNETCASHWMCQKCTYRFMYHMPNLEEYLTVNKLKKVQDLCPNCREPPD